MQARTQNLEDERAEIHAERTRALTELRRREISDTAARLFAERGYHETAIADVAREIGAGHGTIYRYFRNKRDILDHVMDGLAGSIFSALVDRDAPDSARDLDEYRAQVQRIVDALSGLLTNGSGTPGLPPAMRLMLRHADGLDAELHQRFLDLLETCGGLVAAYLENGRERGFVRQDLDARATADAVVALIVGSFLCTHEADPKSRERYNRAAIELMFTGVATA